MKRGGPLKLKTPLKSSPLKAGKELVRKTRLRARPKASVSPQERAAREAFGALPHDARCVVCGRTKAQAWRAGTKLEGHHVISKQKLKSVASARHLDLVSVLWDVRNRVPACGQPCHADHTSRKRPMFRSMLPPQVFVFARELGLSYVIDRDYR